jgi:hypothetical protein
MTHDDIFHQNHDLIEYCGEILATQPRSALTLSRADHVLAMETEGIDRLDVYVDGHPGGPSLAVQGDGCRKVPLPASAREVDVLGFAGGVIRQRRRLALDSKV